MEKIIQDQLDHLKKMQSMMTRLEENYLAEGAYATKCYFSGRRESYEEAIHILEYLLVMRHCQDFWHIADRFSLATCTDGNPNPLPVSLKQQAA